MSDPQERLARLGEIFSSTDPEYAAVREGNIDRVLPSDPHILVTDPLVCQAVYEAAIARLRTTSPRRFDFDPGKHDYLVFRFGAYYAILLRTVPMQVTSGEIVIETGTYPLLVYSVATMQYIFTVGA